MFKQTFERQNDCNPLKVYCDQGGEHQKLVKEVAKEGIETACSAAYCSESNEIGEQFIRTISDMTLVMIALEGLQEEHWREADIFSINLQKRMMTSMSDGDTRLPRN